MATSYDIRVLNSDGTVIAKSRGRAGAIETAMTVLADYRSAVASGSGYAHGSPRAMGVISINGVTGLVGADTDVADLIRDLDKIGAEATRDRYAQIDAELQAERDARQEG